MRTIETVNGKITGAHRVVRGHTMTSEGFVVPDKSREFDVVVDEAGRAYPIEAEAFGPVSPVPAERWGDGDRLGSLFAPNPGEFERCGISFKLCGSAAK